MLEAELDPAALSPSVLSRLSGSKTGDSKESTPGNPGEEVERAADLGCWGHWCACCMGAAKETLSRTPLSFLSKPGRPQAWLCSFRKDISECAED